ncbi:endonuclease/exonuclease/phosphatase family protein [Pseudactinotalea suaedae]|uniref:endonuclease/exonuclease/phosphatase family protein n=1 Tax=Pseudactinotalea suaedae TaxID=1524924 RepID=UPI0012E2088F|nr:endonuclease/exonuclease/phosphatase family protein [Pseudactinotalea suaedae]
MKVLGWVVTAAVVVVGVLTLDPAIVGLSTVTPVLQGIALRGLLAVGALALGVTTVLVSLLLRRTEGRGRRLLVVGLAALVVGVGHIGVVLERGTAPGTAFGVAPDGAIDVLTVNTLGGAGGLDGLSALIDELAPDVVALQETPAEDAERIAAQVGPAYQVFTATTGPQPVQATALLVSTDLGAYRQTDAPATTFGGVWARPVEGVGPELLSVHPVPPVPGDVPTWRSELAALTGLCARVEGVVLAGDFNATVDHAPLRDSTCLDGAVGTGGHGTWPSTRSPLLGTPIDHVLMDPDVWQPIASRVLEAPDGGDHRAVLVRIAPAG